MHWVINKNMLDCMWFVRNYNNDLMGVVVECLSSEVPCVVGDLQSIAVLDCPWLDDNSISDILSLCAISSLLRTHQRFQQTASKDIHTNLKGQFRVCCHKLNIFKWVARCSSMVRAFTHDVMGCWIDPSLWTIDLFLIPACTAQLLAYKRTLSADQIE